jgi:hypothetical protein
MGKHGLKKLTTARTGEATTFPLIVFSVLGHEANIQMSFCLGTPVTLDVHNFIYEPPIEMRSKKVVALVKSFPTACGTPPTRKEIRAILDF